jgi:SAM-dependent methyltransferase
VGFGAGWRGVEHQVGSETGQRLAILSGVEHTDQLNRGTGPLILELGCGQTKRNPDAVGVDVLPYPGVDIVGDALTVLRDLDAGTVDAIYSEHFLEHLDDPEALLEEASRVLRPGGEFRAVVPHFSNPAFYSDPTHRSYWGLYTFGYWVDETPYRRKTPQYRTPFPLRLESTRHVFKSSRPFYVRHGIKKVLSSCREQ